MSTLVAAKNGDGSIICLGSDSLFSTGSFVLATDQTKWLPFDRWCIGISGFVRTCNIIERAMDEQTPHTDAEIYDVCEVIKDALSEDGQLPDSKGKAGPTNFRQSFMAVDTFDRKIWGIDSAIGATDVGLFYAIGSGCEFAMGAWFALPMMGISERVQMAVEAGIKYDAHSGGEVQIVNNIIETEGKEAAE